MGFQLIDDDANIIKDAKKHFDALELKKAGKNYYILGIIGGQSSGKSTLLNHMFNTGFLTLDETRHRRQTTKGIWCAKDPQSNLLVLDIEGSDSRERWEGKTQFERSTALFGLVLSNVLIINLWTQEIGRMAASNYEIIKIIFEINLRFFNQESAKQLLFVIRDFKDTENLEYIQRIITEDVHKLWVEIKKPKQFENLPPEKFFELKFFTLHNFIYEKDKFVKDANDLAQRFREPTSPFFYFKQIDISKNIPFDGLYMFAEKVWNTIKENKELNLPSQKIIVSNFRCSELKKEALELSMKEVEKLKKSVFNNIHENLKTELEEVLHMSLRHFKDNTDQYDDDIVKEMETQLRRDTFIQFDDVSNIQKDKVENIGIKHLREKITQIKNLASFDDLILAMRAAKKETIDKYESDLRTGTTDDENAIKKLVDKFKIKVDGIVVESITTRVNLLLKNMQNTKVKEVEVKMGRIFTELKPNFWDEFKTVFNEIFENYSSEILDLRNSNEELKNSLDDQLFDGMKLDLFYTIRNNVQNKLKNLGSLLLDRFRRAFENTENGMRRNWKVIDEKEINTLFGEAKRECMEILDQAKELNFPPLLNEPEKLMVTREDIAQVKTRVEEDMNHIVERVYNSKYNRGGLSNTPYWVWGLLAYFMHDNILNWITNPFVLFLLVAIAGLFGYLFATGKLGQVISVIQTIFIPVRMILESKGLIPKPVQPVNIPVDKHSPTK